MRPRVSALIYAALGIFAVIAGVYVIATQEPPAAILGSALIVLGSWVAGTAIGEALR